MSVYRTSTHNRQGLTTGDPAPVAGDGEAPLVSTPISQTDHFRNYSKTAKLKRPFKGEIPTPPPRIGSEIQAFSDKSRSRLKHTAVNSGDILKSQFCLTYPGDNWPTDGREFKRHLNLFLTHLRKAYPFLSYLWVAEFQTRGVPHVHAFLDIPPTEKNRFILARIWCRIVNPATTFSDSHWRFHTDPKNFIRWTMGTGSYICKYLDKAAQKAIPPGFISFGRWWGNSRGLVTDPEIITKAEIQAEFPCADENTGECYPDAWEFLVRTVGRYHEKSNRRSFFRKVGKMREINGRKFHVRSVSALTGAPIFRQALEYLRRTRGIPSEISPF